MNCRRNYADNIGCLASLISILYTVRELNGIVGVVFVLHPLGHVSILFLQTRIVNGADVIEIGINGRGRITRIASKTRECAFLPKVLFPISSSVSESDLVLLAI